MRFTSAPVHSRSVRESSAKTAMNAAPPRIARPRRGASSSASTFKSASDVAADPAAVAIIPATQLGMATLVLSLVANPAGQVSEGQRAEEEVVEVAREKGVAMMRIIEGVVRRLAAEDAS